jgi:hypothetical protein
MRVTRRLQLALVGIILSTSAVSAQQLTSSATAPKAAGRLIKSLIDGVAVDRDRTPLPKATVRLRNLQASQIEQTLTTNKSGEFSFSVTPDVPYVVELADQTGRIIAVGDVITVSTGEVAGAVVAIPTKLPALAGIFGETASSVLSAVAGTGLTVVDPNVPPLSPEK